MSKALLQACLSRVLDLDLDLDLPYLPLPRHRWGPWGHWFSANCYGKKKWVFFQILGKFSAFYGKKSGSFSHYAQPNRALAKWWPGNYLPNYHPEAGLFRKSSGAKSYRS